MTSQKAMAPPRPVTSAEASRRMSSGVQAQQSAVTPSGILPPPVNLTCVPPVDNNNIIYSNSNDINDWTDDEWDDIDDDEEMPVSKIFMHSSLTSFYASVIQYLSLIHI